MIVDSFLSYPEFKLQNFTVVFNWITELITFEDIKLSASKK